MRTYLSQEGGDDDIHPNHLSQEIKRIQSKRVDYKLSKRLGPFVLIWASNQLFGSTLS